MASAELIPPLQRLFLREEYAKIDPHLPAMLDALKRAGAGECWHKKSTFYSHLLEVYRICKTWGLPDAVCRCALYHSAYSNSFVNLAIFPPGAGREQVRALIGDEAEELVELFCVVPRQELIQVRLLDAQPPGAAEEPIVPQGGLTVASIRTGEPVAVDEYHLGLFLVLTIADFAEQLYSWQDTLFDNKDGKLRMAGAPNAQPRTLWPGVCAPGCWMAAASRMGRLAAACKARLEAAGDARAARLVLPPVFDGCSRVLGEGDERAARDAYWRVVTTPALQGPEGSDEALALLRECSALNPWVGEPHVLAAQLHLGAGQWEEAAAAGRAGLRLLVQWSTAWDKRMPFGAWVAWARVLLEAGDARDWPREPTDKDALRVLGMGLVGGL